MADIEFSGVTKVYEDGAEAVSELSLHIEEGEFMVFVGPSGCGKTTALRLVAGLEEITEGDVRIGERVVNSLPSKDRDIAMVFQNYALYPQMTVGQNLGFGLRLRGLDKSAIKSKVASVARILGLEEHLDRKPRQLSGGQRQRVAMGRAIVRDPQAFLMDEPLSNLDAKLRVQMRAEISRIQRDLGTTTIYVTHDQTEAMTMGDRVAVMRRSELQQVAKPEELYSYPDNLFVAGFLGSPPMNLIRATLGRDQDRRLAVEFADQRLRLAAEVLSERPNLAKFEGREVVLGIRPEDLDEQATTAQSGPDSALRVTIDLRESLGSDVLLHFELDTKPVETEDTRELARDADPGDVSAAPIERTRLIARVGAHTTLRPKDPAILYVDPRSHHYFDPESGKAIR